MTPKGQDDPGAVGVRMLRYAGECPAIPIYYGVSYCDAVHRAGQGEALRVLPRSIQVCQWAPVILGLKEPAGSFEEHLSPRISRPVGGWLLAPLDGFPGTPELVIVRQTLACLRRLTGRLNGKHLWAGHAGQLELSALALLDCGRPTPRQRLVSLVNRGLAGAARFQTWQNLTHRLFRSHTVTAGFEAVICHTLADMSICRNSTVIPLLTGQVNISYFCAGGITWGQNRPDRLTSGWPWPCFLLLTRRDE